MAAHARVYQCAASVTEGVAGDETTNSQYGKWFGDNPRTGAPTDHSWGRRAPSGFSGHARLSTAKHPLAPRSHTRPADEAADSPRGHDVMRSTWRTAATTPTQPAPTLYKRAATTLGLPEAAPATTGRGNAVQFVSSDGHQEQPLGHADFLRDYAHYRQLQSGIGLGGNNTASALPPPEVLRIINDQTVPMWRGRVLHRPTTGVVVNKTTSGQTTFDGAQAEVVGGASNGVDSSSNVGRLLHRPSTCVAITASGGGGGGVSVAPSVSGLNQTQHPVGRQTNGVESTVIIPLRDPDRPAITTSGSSELTGSRLHSTVVDFSTSTPPAIQLRPQTGYGSTRTSSFPLMSASVTLGGAALEGAGERGETGSRTGNDRLQPTPATQYSTSASGSHCFASQRLNSYYSAPVGLGSNGSPDAGPDPDIHFRSVSLPPGDSSVAPRSVPNHGAQPKRSILKKSSSFSNVETATPVWNSSKMGVTGPVVRWPPVPGFSRDPYSNVGASTMYRQRTSIGFDGRLSGTAAAFDRGRSAATKRVTFSV